MTTLNKILNGKELSCKPVWFMRQAGRYLPEFREIRKLNPNFIKLCLNKELSSEITLQPIKRFDLDAAIIFSDILIIPFALGQTVNFHKNDGPILSEFSLERFLNFDKKIFLKNLEPVYESIKITRKKLDDNKSLISFVGAPWTLLVYMLGLKKNKNEISTTQLNKHKKNLDTILSNLNSFLCLHIEKQIEAGSDVVQIFDSWAGLISEDSLDKYCFKPNKNLVDFCKSKNIPSICFPKGIKKNYQQFNNIVMPSGLNIDYDLDPAWARSNLKNVVIQGGMNPNTLIKTEKEIIYQAKKYLDIFKDVPYIFNLGHGLIPETDPNKLKKLVEFVRKY